MKNCIKRDITQTNRICVIVKDSSQREFYLSVFVGVYWQAN